MSITSRLLGICQGALLWRSRAWQAGSSLRDLALWGLETNSRGHISVQGIDTVDLLARYGSPLLVVNKKRLLEDAEELKEAFARAPKGSKILYSYKTNCVPGILKPLHEAGIGAEVISPYEFWLAQRLGVPPEMIVYNGVDKSDESLEAAVRAGILSINIDHVEEIDRICAIAAKLKKKANVAVRIALARGSQFGLDTETDEALDACRTIKSRPEYLNFQGLHVHLTSNAKEPSKHKELAIRGLEFARKVKDVTGLVVRYLDVGGGFGVPTTKNMNGIEYGIYRLFGVLPKPPQPTDAHSISSFIDELTGAIEDACSRLQLEVPQLIIEPGRLVTSRCEFLLASVRTVKRRKGGQLFAITDAGRLSTTFPCDFEYHEVLVADRPGAAMAALYEVKGRVCTSADWMFKNRLLPELRTGDILAVMDAGAYFSSYSMTFAFGRPAIVMVDRGEAEVIREAESFEYLTALDAQRRDR